MSGCRFQSEPQHNPASVIRKLLTGSTLPWVLRSTVGQWGRRGMINLLACRIVNWIPAINVDAGARDTFTSRHPPRVPESRPHRAVVPRVDYHRPW